MKIIFEKLYWLLKSNSTKSIQAVPSWYYGIEDEQTLCHKGPGSEHTAAQHGLVCIPSEMLVYVNSAHGLTTQPKKCGTNYKTRHNGVIGSLDLSHRNFTWKQKYLNYKLLSMLLSLFIITIIYKCVMIQK